MPIFQTPYDQYADRAGQSYSIIEKITEPRPGYDPEVLPIYRIRFNSDLAIIDAWPEEVEADEIKQQQARGVPYAKPSGKEVEACST